MANVFNAAEVIDMGIEKEKKRRNFYALVSRKFKDKRLKDLFTNLKEWEETHIKKFTDIRDSVEEYEVLESYQGEFESYIKSLVDDKLYKQISPGQFGKNVKTPLQAIQYGIGFEKDAILFFGELIGYMPPIHVEKIKELIDEERKHLMYLNELKRRY